jgi:hypothetical protein
MPIATPNRIADPVTLEAYVPPCILRQEGGLFIPFKNTGSTTSYIAGEPVHAFGRICIVQRTILPGKIGTVIADWMVDVLIKSGGAGNISQGDLVYWDMDEDIVTTLEDTSTVVTDFGAATASVPSNGFVLGRAVMVNEDDTYAAVAASKRVRVVNLPGAPITYGTGY